MLLKSAFLGAAGAMALTLSVTASQAMTVYPSVLSENTTGFSDTLFTGAPDGTSGNNGTAWIGLGGTQVTYDFGTTRVVNGAGQDLNVYEVNYGSPEFGLIAVLASLDGIVFTDISGSIAPWVDVPGDEAHGAPAYAMSYDLGALSEARYIRIQGLGGGGAGGINDFDLDAIAAINSRSVAPVPLPAGLPLLLGGFGLIAGLARRKRG